MRKHDHKRMGTQHHKQVLPARLRSTDTPSGLPTDADNNRLGWFVVIVFIGVILYATLKAVRGQLL